MKYGRMEEFKTFMLKQNWIASCNSKPKKTMVLNFNENTEEIVSL